MISIFKKFAKVLLGRSVIVDIIPPIEFVGWKMATGTRVPWQDGGSNKLGRGFAECDLRLNEYIALGKVILSQFRRRTVTREVAQLRWRHYIVYWSATLASRIAGGDRKNFVELGVCDGLTTWFASHARQSSRCGGEFFLYDAWDEMRSDLLTPSEGGSAGSYGFLNIENTAKNLSHCVDEKFVFNKGYIPESFSYSRNPKEIAWLHIDLNSSMPTIASLDLFWDRLLPGGLVLLDDFAWPGYEETRINVELWCQARDIDILQMPTGQALLTKLSSVVSAQSV